MRSALITGLGQDARQSVNCVGNLARRRSQHWFSQMFRDAPYHQLHAAAKDAPLYRATTWARANPSMRYLPSLKAEIKVLAAAAKRDGVQLQSFKSLRLNMGLPDTVSGVLLEAGVPGKESRVRRSAKGNMCSASTWAEVRLNLRRRMVAENRKT